MESGGCKQNEYLKLGAMQFAAGGVAGLWVSILLVVRIK